MSYYSKTDDLNFVPLTPEEEKDLFTKYYAGDLDARDVIIQRHLKLVIKLALSQAKGGMPDEDAISAGNFGLMQALESKCFDITKNFRFASYVRSYIRGQVLKAMKQRAWQKPVSEDWSHFPEDATLTGVRGTADGSRPADDHQQRSGRSYFLEGSVDHAFEEEQLKSVRQTALENALKKLPTLEALTIRRVDLEGKNYADVGREYGCSREAARKAHARGLIKLRELLEGLRSELA